MKKYAFILLVIFALSSIYSAYSVYILNYINEYILKLQSADMGVLWMFLGLLLGYFALSIFFKYLVAKVNNDFIYDLRTKLVLRICHSDVTTIAKIGKAKILASLSKDIGNLANGFMRILDATQGGLMIIFSLFYFFYISPKIALFLLVWFAIIGAVINVSMQKSYNFHKKSRSNDDVLYANYEMSVDAHREMTLNLDRSDSFLDDFYKNATAQKNNNTQGEIYHAFTSNFLNTMLLCAIGVVMYMALSAGNSLQTAVTISLAILYLRTHIMMLVMSLPQIFMAKISLKKIEELELVPYEEIDANRTKEMLKWREISFENVEFAYSDAAVLKGVNLTIKKGEIAFLVGENGSGKSTLFLIMAGLLTPTNGRILVDGEELKGETLRKFQNSVSVIFSDFYLFKEILNSDDEKIDFWLKTLKMEERIQIIDGQISDLNLSVGQKKRVALIIALLEEKDFLMLDEWAADQDPEFREFFYSEILQIIKKQGISVFAISHDDRFFKDADVVYRIKNGIVEQI